MIAKGSSSKTVTRASAALVIASVFCGGGAYAQSSSAHARVLFAEARKLMDKGRHDEACPKLEESLRLDHGIGTQFNLAHCWEKTGRTASAWGLFLDVAAAADAAGQAKREAAARQRANALEARLTRLTIEVDQAVAGLSVLRSGEEVGRAAWGTAMPVDPGTHRIEVSAPGKRSWSQEVRVDVPGETVSVKVPELEDESIAKLPEASVVQAMQADEGSEGADTGAAGMSSARVAASVVLAAIGVGGIITGTVYGLEASSETSEAQKLCVGGSTGNVCDRDRDLPDFDGGTRERSELERHRQNSERAALISYVGWGVGAAGLVASAIVLFTAPDEAEAPGSAALQLEPVVAPGFWGTAVRGEF